MQWRTIAFMSTKSNQFRYESAYWKRVLDFLKLENIHFKNRLAEVIDFSDGEDNFLNATETYLNSLSQVETMIAILNNDIATFEKLLKRDMSKGSKEFQDILNKSKRIHSDIKELANRFDNIKSEFDDFLMEM